MGSRAHRKSCHLRRRAIDVDQFADPVFSESAVYPVMAGRRPYVGDPFALRQVVSRRTDVAADLLSKLDHHFFRFVILEHDPNTPEGAGFYSGLHLGTDVLARIQANYTFDKIIARARIYVPTTASQ